MNAEFRKGWSAACAAVAEGIRKGVTTRGTEMGVALCELADEIEATPPPKTMTVVDEEGRRLL